MSSTPSLIEQYKEAFKSDIVLTTKRVTNDEKQDKMKELKPTHNIQEENEILKREVERLKKKNDELNFELIELRMYKLMCEKKQYV